MEVEHSLGGSRRTRLWLVRHGQTDWNLEGRYQGQADVPLNATGEAQARNAAEQLARSGERFSAVYSSDLQRAWRTAEAIADRLGVPLHEDTRLREVDQGDWEGMLFTELAVRFADRMAQRKEDPLGTRPPNGESLAELAARTAQVADEIAARHCSDNVVLVSHGLTLAVLIALGRGIPLTEAYSLIPANTQPEVVAWGASAGTGQ